MLTKRPNHDRRPEIFRLAMEDFGVNHGADTSEFLPQLSIKTVLHIEVWRVKTDSVDAVLFCQPDGALMMNRGWYTAWWARQPPWRMSPRSTSCCTATRTSSAPMPATPASKSAPSMPTEK
eukprot:109593_1